MSKPAVKIVATYADGKTLDEFQKVLEKRQHYLGETAFQSIHAMAIEALKSIRGLTRVAKPSGIKVTVTQRTDLKFSYFTEGGSGFKAGSKSERKLRNSGYGINVRRSDSGHYKMCIRSAAGMRFEDNSIGKFVFANLKGVKRAAVQVYQFKDEGANNKIYIIAATSQAAAKKVAQNIVARRVLKYSGLAKRAVSALMVKTNSKGPSDSVSPRVYAKANEVTTVKNQVARNSDGSGVYSLTCVDDLRYATRALNGGPSVVDLALRKAANKSVGLISHKCKDLLLPGELKTPFPEITKKKAA